MALSPNAGKNEYLLEKHTGIIHNLKNETENCKILEVGPVRSTITNTYEQAAEIALFECGNKPTPCQYCCKE